MENRAQVELPVELTAGTRLKVSAAGEVASARWTLPPLGSRELLLTLPAEDVEDFKGEIVLMARGASQAVAVSAAPAGPWLRLQSATTDPPSVLQTDSVLQVPKNPGNLVLTLRNAGGQPAALFADVPSGFQVEGEALGKSLRPKSDAILTVSVAGGMREAPTGELNLTFGGESLKFSLKGDVPEAPAGAGSSASSGFFSKDSTGSNHGAAGSRELSLDDREMRTLAMVQRTGIFPQGSVFDRSLPDVTAGGVPRFGSDSVTFVMKDLGPDFSFVIFRSVSKPGPGSPLPMKYWVPWENVEQKRLPGVVECTLRPLQPGLRYVICVAARHADGRMGLATDPVFFYPPSRSWAWLGWTLLVLGGIAGAIAWWVRRKNADLVVDDYQAAGGLS